MHLLATYLTIAALLLNTLAQYMPQDDGQDNYDYDNTDYTDLVEAQTNAADLKNLIYRLDLLPCPKASFPSDVRKWKAYRTWSYYNYWSKSFRCYAKKIGENSINSDDNNSSLYYLKVRTTYIDKAGVKKYKPRLIEKSKFQCPDGTVGTIEMLETKIESKKAIGEDLVCLDYLKYKIVRPNGSGGTGEYCGDQFDETLPPITDDGHNFIVETIFRSGFGGNDEGFNMTILCYNQTEADAIDQDTCLQTSDENQATSINSYFNDFKTYYYEYFGAVKQQSRHAHTIPSDARIKLLNFHKEHHDIIHSAEWGYDNKDVLALAILSKQSCDIKLRTIGHAVSLLFPQTLVLDATIQAYEYFKK